MSCRQISAGHAHICVLWDGRVRCWGNGSPGGATGLDDRSALDQPLVPFEPGSARPTQLSAGDGHTCAVFDGGQLRCWGKPGLGLLGPALPAGQPVPASPLPGPVVTAFAGQLASCALGEDGRLLCWGENDFGQLGVANYPSVVIEPTESTEAGRPVKDLAMSRDLVGPHTCGLAGTPAIVHCFGRGGPSGVITGLTEPVAVRVGIGRGCALEASAVLRCWPGATPVAATTTLSDVRHFDVGRSHACAATGDGRVHCWGDNRDGALGTGQTGGTQELPHTVPDLTDVFQVATGDGFSCALARDGRLWCWGRNHTGQLGIGPLPRLQLNPVLVAYE